MSGDPLEQARTRSLGLFGNPVEHSFSPLFMNYTIGLLGLNYRYLAFTLEEKDLGAAVQAVRTLGFRGVNITIPFKRDVFKHLQQIDRTAARIGAVNCVVNNDGRLEGHNTDYRGFLKPLEDRGFSPGAKAVLILGSGGAARAVIAGCVEAGAAEIAVLNRTEAKGLDLVRWCSSTFHFSSITYRGSASSLSSRALRTFDLIVNATPVGMYPHVEGSPLPDHLSFGTHQTVYDLIYNPWRTRLIGRAEASGASVLNGFEMLIIQGLYSLALWFPERADEVMGLQEEVFSHTRERVRDFNAPP